MLTPSISLNSLEHQHDPGRVVRREWPHWKTRRWVLHFIPFPATAKCSPMMLIVQTSHLALEQLYVYPHGLLALAPMITKWDHCSLGFHFTGARVWTGDVPDTGLSWLVWYIRITSTRIRCKLNSNVFLFNLIGKLTKAKEYLTEVKWHIAGH